MGRGGEGGLLFLGVATQAARRLQRFGSRPVRERVAARRGETAQQAARWRSIRSPHVFLFLFFSPCPLPLSFQSIEYVASTPNTTNSAAIQRDREGCIDHRFSSPRSEERNPALPQMTTAVKAAVGQEDDRLITSTKRRGEGGGRGGMRTGKKGGCFFAEKERGCTRWPCPLGRDTSRPVPGWLLQVIVQAQ